MRCAPPAPARYALHDYCTTARTQLLDCDALDVLSELQAHADTSVSEAATHIFQKVVPLIPSVPVGTRDASSPSSRIASMQTGKLHLTHLRVQLLARFGMAVRTVCFKPKSAPEHPACEVVA